MLIFKTATLNLLRNRRRTLLALGMLAICAAAAVLTMSYIAGTVAAIKETIIRGNVGHFQIALKDEFFGVPDRPLQFGLNKLQQEDIEAKIATIPSVRAVFGRIAFEGLIGYGERTVAAGIVAIDPSIDNAFLRGAIQIVRGTALSVNAGAGGEALIGEGMAARLGVAIGDEITIVSPTARGGLNAADFKIRGVFKTGIPEADLRQAYVSRNEAMDLLRTEKFSRYFVLLKKTDGWENEELKIKSALPSLEVRNWITMAPIYIQIKTLYENQFKINGSVLIFVMFLSVFHVISSNISERIKEIGTLRAIGFSSRKIMAMLGLEGAMLGMLGALVGLFLAFLFVIYLQKFPIILAPPPGRTIAYPLSIRWETTSAMIVVFFSISLCVIASFLASFTFTRMQISKALRND
jgi:putative ABC transport system permease protein